MKTLTPQQMRKRLEETGEGIANAGDAGLVELATQIMRVAQKFVPRQTGALAASAFVSIVRSHGLQFGYGKDYAPDVHQRTGNGSMWLQRAVMAFTGDVGLKIVAGPILKAARSRFRGKPQASTEFKRAPDGN